ncbi:HIG1 domain family member 1A, mitochondrial-like [Bacillus rossius redtenbacheri]|uniref:HIG1 domain family member 1A, mitochondrial-like n=1 Tax=Bacillus rossius redtenbacheri TaxID=93214 RepID=UPI002FDD3963
MADDKSRGQAAMETSLSMSFDEESNTEKLARKTKDAPFLVAGVVGCTLACAYGAYMFKRRSLPMSVYLIQLRVAAQGTVVGCLAVGLAYSLARTYLFKPSPDDGKK